MAYDNRRQAPGRSRPGGDRGDAPARPSIDTSGIDLRPGANGALNPDLFDTVAHSAAKVIGSNERGNKPAQIRQFYDELVMWEEKVRQNPAERFPEFLPFIRMLNAKAAYAQGRGHVDENFVALIARCLQQVDSAQTLRNFKLFFEAFLGFYKLEGPKG
jgi:CRISPR-associated protein Csm2